METTGMVTLLDVRNSLRKMAVEKGVTQGLSKLTTKNMTELVALFYGVRVLSGATLGKVADEILYRVPKGEKLPSVQQAANKQLGPIISKVKRILKWAREGKLDKIETSDGIVTLTSEKILTAWAKRDHSLFAVYALDKMIRDEMMNDEKVLTSIRNLVAKLQDTSTRNKLNEILRVGANEDSETETDSLEALEIPSELVAA